MEDYEKKIQQRYNLQYKALQDMPDLAALVIDIQELHSQAFAFRKGEIEPSYAELLLKERLHLQAELRKVERKYHINTLNAKNDKHHALKSLIYKYRTMIHRTRGAIIYRTSLV